jgi:hypothetical protein
MKPNLIMGGVILTVRSNATLDPTTGHETPVASDFLEVTHSWGDVAGDGTIHVYARSTRSARDNYRPFEIYGDGTHLRLRPDRCELVAWRHEHPLTTGTDAA